MPDSAQPTLLITGATGTLGRHLLPLLTDDFRVRVLSRAPHESTDGVEYVVGDLMSGAGVSVAVQGIEVILHCAGSPKGDEVKTRTLLDAAVQEGAARHVVYVSVVGADRVPVTSAVDRAMFGYYAAKYASEQLITQSGLPWTILRATQFHDLLLKAIGGLTTLPVVPVPSLRFQPVETSEVAVRLAEVTRGEPAGLVPDVAGPEVASMKELVATYLRATHKRRLLLPMRMPGGAGRALRAGAHLAPDRAVGVRTWAEFLADTPCVRHPTSPGSSSV